MSDTDDPGDARRRPDIPPVDKKAIRIRQARRGISLGAIVFVLFWIVRLVHDWNDHPPDPVIHPLPSFTMPSFAPPTSFPSMP